METETVLKIIKSKLKSMRYSKKEVQKEMSQDAKQFMYGYTECINDLLKYVTAGKDGLPEHDLSLSDKEVKSADEILINFLDEEGFEITEEAINKIIQAMQEYANQFSGQPVSDDMIEKEAYNYCATPSMSDGEPEMDQKAYNCFIEGAKWLRSQIKPK